MFNFGRIFHVGLTTRCNLLCPLCPRTTQPEKVKPASDVDVNHLINFITLCKPEAITFCGNWGDPIFYPEFLKLIEEIRKVLPKTFIVIHTNGSGKTAEWWKTLMELLGRNSLIYFSIDGTPDNYTTYRINSKWSQVLEAVQTCISNKLNDSVHIVWKYIVFSYNEDTIMEAYKLSKELGFDDFMLSYGIVDTKKHMHLKTSIPHEQIVEKFNNAKNNTIL